MRLALGLALVASLAFGAEAGEATAKPKGWQLDAPFSIVQDGETLLELPAGTVLTKESFEKVDQEFTRLQRVEQVHLMEPSPWIWMLAGGVVGAIGTAVLLVGFWLVSR